MKKMKVLSISLIIVTLLFSICNVSNAASKHTAGEIISDGQSFIKAGEGQQYISEQNLENMSTTLYNILLVAGIIIAVGIGLILGIKFILGSVEQQAQIKAMLLPYVIGVVVVFGAFTIWKIVVDILQTME